MTRLFFWAFLMAYSLLGSTKAGNVATTGSVDTSGADLIVIVQSSYNNSGSSAPTDNKSNTWSSTTNRASGTDNVRIWYVRNPVVGSGHTFTAVAASGFASICVAWYSGSAASPVDQENGAAGGTPGSITPTQDNELIVTGASAFGNSTAAFSSIDAGFTCRQNEDGHNGVDLFCALSDLIQTTAGAANPTWTVTGTSSLVSTIVSFKAASGGTNRPVKMAGLWGGYAGESGGFAG